MLELRPVVRWRMTALDAVCLKLLILTLERLCSMTTNHVSRVIKRLPSLLLPSSFRQSTKSSSIPSTLFSECLIIAIIRRRNTSLRRLATIPNIVSPEMTLTVHGRRERWVTEQRFEKEPTIGHTTRFPPCPLPIVIQANITIATILPISMTWSKT